jgi:hypothetical protein
LALRVYGGAESMLPFRAVLIKSASCRFRSRPSIWLAEYPSRFSDVMMSVSPATRPDLAS